MTVSTSGVDGTGNVAVELYPLALKQARFEALMNLATWIGWGAFWAV